jgi:hypothetical protein
VQVTGRTRGVRLLAVLIALVACFFGLMCATLPNAQQPVMAAFLFGYGAVTLVLALFASSPKWKAALEWFLFLSIGLIILANLLPQGFWRLVGLRN